ncbi:DUF2189 domain-containing protein [Parahaliea aestuarii]|nr:DUF2189 domain-containing protein [Parahaliea aestuarii]
MTRPLVWLGRGWQDLLHQPLASLAWGALVSGLGALILAYGRHPYFIAAMASGFLLVGPVITAGLCELSRRRDCGEPGGFEDSLAPLRRNRKGLTEFAQILLLVSLVWFTLSASILYFALGEVAPAVTTTVWGDVMLRLSVPQLTAYIGSGALLALLVFTLSVVTVPMIVDRHVDASTAMHTSLQVSLRDAPAMAVWAVVVTGLVIVGFATGLIAMVLIFPVLGHATWQAYRDLVY